MSKVPWYNTYDLLARGQGASVSISGGPDRVSHTPSDDDTIPEAKTVGFTGPQLEGADTKVPLYMTQPEGPRWTATGVGGREVEICNERGVMWLRSRWPGGHWPQWRRMNEKETDHG